MIRFPRAVGGVSVLALLLTLTSLAPPAGALHEAPSACLVVTEDTTLTADIGPCATNGIVVVADDVTLDLGGNTVFADNGPEETVGILLAGVTGVTVRNGTVEGFDAGVAIIGGGGNTIRNLNVLNNVNDFMEPFDPRDPDLTPEQLRLVLCDYGDGITTSDSDNNVIEHNLVVGNGPYSGISLVGDSDGNLVQKNRVQDNNILNGPAVDEEGNPIFVDSRRFLDEEEEIPNPDFGRHVSADSEGAEQVNAMCGAVAPGSPGMSRGREVQNIGIRIEGPGADDNVIENNKVDNSALVGISIHSYVCTPPPGFETGAQDPNTGNLITKNDVRRTGAETFEIDSFADGIASLAQGPIGRVTCTSPDNTIVKNRSTDNLRHGISLGRTVSDTTVNDNQVMNNAADGIRVEDGAVNNTLHGNKGLKNAEHDGHDGNEDCDNNSWVNNKFFTVNQPCVGPGKKNGAPGDAAGTLDLANRGRS